VIGNPLIRLRAIRCMGQYNKIDAYVKRRNISDWSKLRYANTRVQQYVSWDSTLIIR